MLGALLEGMLGTDIVETFSWNRSAKYKQTPGKVAGSGLAKAEPRRA